GEAPASYRRLEKALNARDLAVVETAEFLRARQERETARREADERARVKALAPRIAELKQKFAEKVWTQEVQSWDRDQFKARVRDAVKSWEGVVLFASGLAKHSLDQYDPKNQFTVEPPSAAGFRYDELKEMAGLPVSVDDLRNDPRSAGGSLV